MTVKQKQVEDLSADLAALSARLDTLEAEDKISLFYAASASANSASFNEATTVLLPLDTLEYPTTAPPGVTLAGNEITGIPAGDYRIDGGSQIELVGGTRGFVRFKVQLNNADQGVSGHAYARSAGNNDGASNQCRAWLTIAPTDTIRIQCIETPGSTGNGTYQTVGGEGFIEIFRLQRP